MPVEFTEVPLAILSALGGGLVAWLALDLRNRVLARLAFTRAETRANERIGAVRELHDTLLQGVQGLLLTFHVVCQKMTANEEPRVLMERALSTAERMVLDARGRVGNLMREQLIDAELVGALRSAGSELNHEGAVHCSVRRFGTRTTLEPAVVDQIFFIAREALTNGFRHAQASQIALELDYGNRFFSMVCEDNGHGFDFLGRRSEGQRGLAEIEQRTRDLGGQWVVHTAPGHGARVSLVVPSYLAYPRSSRLMFYLRAWRFSERNPLYRSRATLPGARSEPRARAAFGGRL